MARYKSQYDMLESEAEHLGNLYLCVSWDPHHLVSRLLLEGADCSDGRGNGTEPGGCC